MLKTIYFPLKQMVFWLLVFLVNRIFFILYQLPIGNKIKHDSDLYKSLYKGYQLDLSIGATFILPSLLFIIIYTIVQKKIFKQISTGLVLLFLILYTIAALSDAGLYREWNGKINMQALEHFKNPAEVFKTIPNKLLFFFALLVIVLVSPFFYLYVKKIHTPYVLNEEKPLRKRLLFAIPFFMITTTIGVFTIRGGIDNMPINQSIAYFSNDVLANDIAVNPLYNLLQDFDIKSKLPDRSTYMVTSNQEAIKLIAPDYTVKKDTTIPILKNNRPNLVFIFLESWSADNVSVLGGIEGCTPEFNKLSEEGLLFTQAYSDAYVSDQGIVAGLSAYPSAHRMAIANQPKKIPNLPCISEDLLKEGYSASFLFGGELVYGNLRGYLLEKKFSDLKEIYDLRKYPEGKIGVHDQYTFKELLEIINHKKSPFLQGFFTTSTHMPYDYEPTDNWQSAKDDPEKKYTESHHYSDSHMGNFFREAKKQKWYENTLFILVADHGHNSIKQWNPVTSMKHHIPLLFLGGALKDEWKGKRWDKIVSQLDIVSTLLHQMNLSSKDYPWSRNMLNPYTSSSAFYVFYGGAGYVNDSGFAAVSYDNKDYVTTNLTDSSLIEPFKKKALAFQQLVFENVRIRK